MHIDLIIFFDRITCMFWLEAKVQNDMGMFWLINLIMMTDLTICQIVV
jgi:hypothetical protein